MNEQHRQQALAILESTDDELRAAINRLDDPRAQGLGMLALRVPRSDRLKLARQIQRSRNKSSEEMFTCKECGVTKAMDEEADSAMCWECWLLLMA